MALLFVLLAVAPCGLLAVAVLSLTREAEADHHEKPAAIRFEEVELDAKFRSEGVAVADFNNDGLNDIAAGFVWYEAPDWKMHTIAKETASANNAVLGSPPHYKPKGYSNAFSCFADDLDGDGWIDLLVVDFPSKPTWWYRNPGAAGGEWQKHLAMPVTNNESPAYADMDGDGVNEIIAAFAPSTQEANGPERQMGIIARAADATSAWTIRPISRKGAPGCRVYYHGLGVGDVNSDGRVDVLCSDGWWESPASAGGEEASAALWKFHPAEFGEAGDGERRAAHLHVDDFDGDGDADVLSSSPHSYGIWWHEQLADGTWQTHEIDTSYSQTHAVCVADINGDGLTDFVTGKRWWAHGGGDPGGDEPAVFCWYEQRREQGADGGTSVKWIRHQFDDDSGPGTQFQTADVDGDGLVDIVTSNKKGVRLFLQRRG
ncbi:MAG: VCBS repeat-containing protein [Planctomycetota bacterium]|nr:MAG: VCBS repeat-containing protein [Planctomycetota bacterium]REK26381.1 MAG: VCBS repeat-containing protein [Planctomycetota bacterium]REK37930.1 MAG: VCBS repeat-containing protein [Planctomycetota bacterium]